MAVLVKLEMVFSRKNQSSIKTRQEHEIYLSQVDTDPHIFRGGEVNMFAFASRLFSQHRATPLLTLALCVAISAIPARAQSKSAISGLTGTWRVQVTLVNCSTGESLAPSFSSLLTFARGGTLTGTTRNPVFQPGQRSGDFGIWWKAGREYYADSEAFILFTSSTPPIFQSGTQRISQSITLDGDNFESVAVTRFYDVNGALLNTGCARALGTRYQ